MRFVIDVKYAASFKAGFLFRVSPSASVGLRKLVLSSLGQAREKLAHQSWMINDPWALLHPASQARTITPRLW